MAHETNDIKFYVYLIIKITIIIRIIAIIIVNLIIKY